MCDNNLTESQIGEMTICERCLQPLIFAGHPQLCIPCRVVWHTEAQEWRNITELVLLDRQPAFFRWELKGLAKQYTMKNLLILNIPGQGFQIYGRRSLTNKET